MAFNILVVDDSKTMQAVIAKTLNLSGLPVGELLQAGNGREGLETLRRHWIDIVFADINMPVMNGIRMVEEMRADAVLRSIPIVVISTEGNEDRIQALRDQGIRAFLRKPFRPEILKQTVEEILGVRHA